MMYRIVIVLFWIISYQAGAQDTLWISDKNIHPSFLTSTLYNTDGQITGVRTVEMGYQGLKFIGYANGIDTTVIWLYDGEISVDTDSLPGGSIHVGDNVLFGLTDQAEIKNIKGTFSILKQSVTGDVSIDLNPVPLDSISDANVSIGRGVETTGMVAMTIWDRDSMEHYLSGTGHSYLSLAGNLGIGTSNPQRKFHVDGGVMFSAYGQGNFSTDSLSHYLGVEPDGDIVEVSQYGFPESLKWQHFSFIEDVSNKTLGAILDSTHHDMTLTELKVYSEGCTTGSFDVTIYQNGASKGTANYASGDSDAVKTVALTATTLSANDVIKATVVDNSSDCTGLLVDVYIE